jgi:hypothetical protein
LRAYPRAHVRDVLRQFDISTLKNTLAGIDAAGARAAATAGAAAVNNDLRIIGSAIDAGIPTVVTADVQFAARAAKNGLQVQFRIFDPTMGPVNRIMELGSAARRLDAAKTAGHLSAAERARITF